MIHCAGRSNAAVTFASPASQPPRGRQAASNAGPAARWIAPSTPPPPRSDEFAAFTIASTISCVISPRTTSSRTGARMPHGRSIETPTGERLPTFRWEALLGPRPRTRRRSPGLAGSRAVRRYFSFVGRGRKGDRCRRRVGLGGGVVVAVIVLICVVLAVPGLAFVSRSVHTVLVPSNSGTDNDKSACASCPGGEHVQFGGFASNVATRGMRRSADNQWTVDGLTAPSPKGSSFTGKVTSIAYRAYGPVPLKVTYSKRITGSGGVTATCPAGTVVVAGGFATSPHSRGRDPGSRSGRSRPMARAGRNCMAVRTTLTSVAYCGKGPEPKLVSSRVAQSSHPPFRTVFRTTAMCPAGKSLRFGGVIVRGGNVFTLQAQITDSWRVTGDLTSGRHGYLTALAVLPLRRTAAAGPQAPGHLRNESTASRWGRRIAATDDLAVGGYQYAPSVSRIRRHVDRTPLAGPNAVIRCALANDRVANRPVSAVGARGCP